MSDQTPTNPETPKTSTETEKTARMYSEAELETIIKDRLARAKEKEQKAVAEAAEKAAASTKALPL